MSEQSPPSTSQREEMNAAIRAQRERHNVPRSIAGEPDHAPPPPAEPEPEPEKPKGFFARLRGK
jgi:hypothetical protein